MLGLTDKASFAIIGRERPRRESNPLRAALEAAARPSGSWGRKVSGGACRPPHRA